MEIPTKNALIISSHVTGLEPLEGAYKNAEDASKVLRRMKIPAECQFGGRLSLTQFMGKIEEFFETESDLHILWGIFHGERGCWVLSNKELVSLFFILQKWYFAREKGTAHHLLIVSDACESGHMVTEAAELELEDVSVQASCHPNFISQDVEEECFSDLLVWRLERRYGSPMSRSKHVQDPFGLEKAILNRHQPCFYSAVDPHHLGWIFVNDSSASSQDPSDYSSDAATAAAALPEKDEGCFSFATRAPMRRLLRMVALALCIFLLVLMLKFCLRHLRNTVPPNTVPPAKETCFDRRLLLRFAGSLGSLKPSLRNCVHSCARVMKSAMKPQCWQCCSPIVLAEPKLTRTFTINLRKYQGSFSSNRASIYSKMQGARTALKRCASFLPGAWCECMAGAAGLVRKKAAILSTSNHNISWLRERQYPWQAKLLIANIICLSTGVASFAGTSKQKFHHPASVNRWEGENNYSMIYAGGWVL